MANPKLVLCKKCMTITEKGLPCDCTPTSLEALARAIEDKAAKYGGAAMQPIGVEMGPKGEKHTRTNRVKLTFLSCGLNEAAGMLREFIATQPPAPSPAAAPPATAKDPQP
jgi:hypothetical protein